MYGLDFEAQKEYRVRIPCEQILPIHFLFRPLFRGKELYTQMGFLLFSQFWVLRLVSLESFSSAEYGIKKILLISFFTGSYRCLNFEKIE